MAVAGLLGELGYPTTPHEAGERLTRMAARESDRVIVATADERVVGVASVHRFDGLHDAMPVTLITSIVVAGSARGTGAGSVLLDAMERIAREWGSERIIVTSHNRRADAHAFYERRGYEHTGRRFVKALA